MTHDSIVRDIPITFPDDDASCNLIADQLVAAGFHELARQLRVAIKERAKPTEPTEYGSIVLARADERGKRERWCSPTAEPGWYSESGAWVASYSMLTDIEVLRVGLGEVPSDSQKAAQDDAYVLGRTEGTQKLAADLHDRLIYLLSQAITSERKNAYEKAIQAVEELAP